MELKERIAELEGMIAKTNVNNAIKESEILVLIHLDRISR